MILDNIIEKRKEQLEREKSAISLSLMKEIASGITVPTRDFKKAITGEKLAVISEIKKASPSKGLICEDFNPMKIAVEYEQSGANAISCLTEEYYFQGSSEFLKNIRAVTSLPILRKDFIFDEYQIFEARAIGADAILLIASILDLDRLKELYSLAKSLGLSVLTEVHNEQELRLVLEADCDIIGINNRNLKTFEVSIATTQALIKMIPDGKIIVSESGISTNDDMKQIKGYGANAVLIGETLMRSESISETLNDLRRGV